MIKFYKWDMPADAFSTAGINDYYLGTAYPTSCTVTEEMTGSYYCEFTLPILKDNDIWKNVQYNNWVLIPNYTKTDGAGVKSPQWFYITSYTYDYKRQQPSVTAQAVAAFYKLGDAFIRAQTWTSSDYINGLSSSVSQIIGMYSDGGGVYSFGGAILPKLSSVTSSNGNFNIATMLDDGLEVPMYVVGTSEERGEYGISKKYFLEDFDPNQRNGVDALIGSNGFTGLITGSFIWRDNFHVTIKSLNTAGFMYDEYNSGADADLETAKTQMTLGTMFLGREISSINVKADDSTFYTQIWIYYDRPWRNSDYNETSPSSDGVSTTGRAITMTKSKSTANSLERISGKTEFSFTDTQKMQVAEYFGDYSTNGSDVDNIVKWFMRPELDSLLAFKPTYTIELSQAGLNSLTEIIPGYFLRIVSEDFGIDELVQVQSVTFDANKGIYTSIDIDGLTASLVRPS